MSAAHPDPRSSPSAPTLSRRQVLDGFGFGAVALVPLAGACATDRAHRGQPADAAFERGAAAGALRVANGRECAAYAAPALRAPLRRTTLTRREVGAEDVDIDVLHCGVCHSDIHQVNNDWKNTLYPCVPGHEIVGRAKEVGGSVRGVEVGDVVAVGAIVDSCGACASCREGVEPYCTGPQGAISTYNGPYKADGTNTFGGYSRRIVVPERFVHRVPEALHGDLPGVAPLLCAGITTYSPLKHWRVAPGQRVAIVGMGGLGHMGVKLAAAMGAKVTVVSTTPDKAKDARAFGAEEFVLANDGKKLRELGGTFDLVLDTAPYVHEVAPLLELVKRDGVFVMVGLLVPFALDNSLLAFHRRTVASSVIGGMPETRAMLDFCAQHGITATVERLAMDRINEGFAKVQANKVRYRYVLDVADSLPA
jgi:uncharacterized zinc-type alcohol dehydrogenase-like protein